MRQKRQLRPSAQTALSEKKKRQKRRPWSFIGVGVEKHQSRPPCLFRGQVSVPAPALVVANNQLSVSVNVSG